MVGYDWVRITNDQKVSLTPCAVGSVVITSDGTGATSVTLYDGESTDDPKLLSVKAANGTTRVVNLNPPLITKRGLYVDLGNNADTCLIQYERYQEKTID